MDEKYLQGLYKQLGGQKGLGGTYADWSKAIQNNEEYKQGLFDQLGGEKGLGGTYQNWNSSVFGVKKKDGIPVSQVGAEEPIVSAQAQPEEPPEAIDEEFIFTPEEKAIQIAESTIPKGKQLIEPGELRPKEERDLMAELIASAQEPTPEEPTEPIDEELIFTPEEKAVQIAESTIPVDQVDQELKIEAEAETLKQKRKASKQFFKDQEKRAASEGLGIVDYRRAISKNVAREHLSEPQQEEFNLLSARNTIKEEKDVVTQYYKDKGLSQEEIDEKTEEIDQRLIKASDAVDIHNINKAKRVNAEVLKLKEELVTASEDDKKGIQEEIAQLEASITPFFGKDIPKIAEKIMVTGYLGEKPRVSKTPEKDILEYYHGLIEEGQQLADRMGVVGAVKGVFTGDVARLAEVQAEIRELAPIVLIDRQSEKKDNPWTQLVKHVAQGIVPSARPSVLTEQQHAEIITNTLDFLGVQNQDISKVHKKVLAFNQEMTGWEEFLAMTGTTIGMMPEFVFGAALTETGIGAAKGIRTTAKLLTKLEKLSKTNRLTRALTSGVREGIEYEAAGLFASDKSVEEEASFLSGYLGYKFKAPIAKALQSKLAKKMLGSVFGNQSDKAYKLFSAIGKKGAMGIGEVAEEYGNEFAGLIQDSGNADEFYSLLEERFGTLDQNLKFGASVFFMGTMLGTASQGGRAGIQAFHDWRSKQSPEVQENFDEVIAETEEAINEVNAEEVKEEEVKEEVKEQPELELMVKAEEGVLTKEKIAELRQEHQKEYSEDPIKATENRIKETEESLEEMGEGTDEHDRFSGYLQRQQDHLAELEKKEEVVKAEEEKAPAIVEPKLEEDALRIEKTTEEPETILHPEPRKEDEGRRIQAEEQQEIAKGEEVLAEEVAERPLPEVEAVPPTEKVVKPKERFTTKSGLQTVEFIEGELQVKNKDGSEPSPPTRRKAIREYEDTVDYDQGEKAIIEVQPANIDELHTQTLETSENPQEIAEVYQQRQKDVEDILAARDKDAVIAENISVTNAESLTKVGDISAISSDIKRSYTRKGAFSLDVLAQEMTANTGQDITEQDLYEFMRKFPAGSEQYFREVAKDPIRAQASERFKELTGLDLNERVLTKINENSLRKQGALNQDIYDTYQGKPSTELRAARDQYQQWLSEQTFDKEGNIIDDAGRIEEAPEVKEIESIKDIDTTQESGLDKVSSILDQLSKDLDQFGKTTLGMNLPVAVAKVAVDTMNGAVKAAKVAAKTGVILFKTGAELLEIGKQAVIDSKWYETLTAKQKKDLEENFETIIKQPSLEAVAAKKEPVKPPPTKKPPKAKAIFDNVAIFPDKKGVSESIAKKTFTDQEYEKISFDLIDKETKRIIKDNPPEIVLEAAMDLNNDMNNALRANLIQTLGGNALREGDMITHQKLMDVYKKTGVEAGQSLVARKMIRNNPDFTVNNLLTAVAEKKAEALEKPTTEGTTVEKEIEASFEEIQKAIKGKLGITVEELTEEKVKKIREKRETIKERARKEAKKGLSQFNDFTTILAQSVTLGADIIELAGTYIAEGIVRMPEIAKRIKADLGITFTKKDNKTLDEFLKQNVNLEDVITKELIRLYGISKIKQPKKAIKSDAQKIMEAIENGAFNSEMYTDLVADKFGIPFLSKEDIMTMTEMAETINGLDGGSLKARELIKFNTFIEDLRKRGKRSGGEIFASIAENFLSFYYVSILSGLSTTSRASKGAIMTSVAKTFVKLLANPKATLMARKFRKDLFRQSALWRGDAAKEVYRSGFSPVHYTDTEVGLIKQGLNYMDRITNETTKEIIESKDYNTFKKQRRLALKYVLFTPTMVYRTLLAMDVLMRAPMVELFTYMNEYERLVTEGRPKAEKAFANKLINAMGNQTPVVQRAEVQFNDEMEYIREEGLKVPSDYKKTRINEILEQQRNQDSVNRAKRMADEALLMQDPEGWLGGIYRSMASFGAVGPEKGTAGNLGSLFFKMIFPILRVPTNFINTALDYTPVGYIKAATKKTKTRTGFREFSPSERRELNITATMGMVVAGTLATMLFDWDDEEGVTLNPDAPIQITSKGKGDYFKNIDMPSGYKMNSWRYRKPNGEWSDYYSFVDNPMGMILSPFGYISDQIRFKKPEKPTKDDIEKDKKTFKGVLAQMGIAAANFATSQSYSQGMKDISKMLSGEEDVVAKSSERITKRAAKSIFPNFYKQIYKQLEAYRDMPEKDAKGMAESLYKDLPMLNSLIDNVKYDHFGYPIRRKFEIPLIPDLILDMMKENRDYRETKKEWQLVYKFPAVTLGNMPRASNTWSQDKAAKFHKEYGDKLKEYIGYNYVDLNAIEEPYKLQAILSSYKSQAKAYAKTLVKEIKE